MNFFEENRELFKQEGTARGERFSQSLNPENILIDDRNLQDLILFAQRFSKNLRFIDTEGDSAQSWLPFFESKNDIILLAGNIAARSVQNVKTKYNFLYQEFKGQTTPENLATLINFIFDLFRKINGWYAASRQDTRLFSDLNIYIHSYLQMPMGNLLQLVERFQGFKSHVHIAFSIEENMLCIREEKNDWNGKDEERDKEEKDKKYPHHAKDYDDLSNYSSSTQNSNTDKQDKNGGYDKHEQKLIKEPWAIPAQVDPLFGQRIFIGEDDEEKLYQASLSLNEIFETAFYVFEKVVINCQNNFEDIIKENQNHQPHIVLLVAFFKLFGYAQKELNALPQRHLDYYYQQVLNIRPKEAIPDQAFVLFELVKDFDKYKINADTALSAGKDPENKELVYETDKDIVVYKAEVASINTTFIEKVKGNVVNCYAKSYDRALLVNRDKPIKIFGEKNPENLSSIGFAIASSQFYVTGGERKITLTFDLDSPLNGNDKIKDFIDDTRIKFDNSDLELILTGEKGWLSSANAADFITINSVSAVNNFTVEISFTIAGKQASAIAGFNKKLHFENFNTSLPVAKCYISHRSSQYAGAEAAKKVTQANYLQTVKIKGCKIKTEVGDCQRISFDGAKNILVQNDETPVLDTTKPFMPFTPVPKKGSAMYIICPEFLEKQKQLLNSDDDNDECLSINMEWMLPDKFSSYYTNYPPPYNTNEFLASVSVLIDKEWKLIGDYQIIDKDTPYKRIKIGNDDLIRTKALRSNSSKPIHGYDALKPNGTIKIELEQDFGQSIYPQLIVATSLAKATSDKKTPDYLNIIKDKLNSSNISLDVPDEIKERKGPFFDSLKLFFDKEENAVEANKVEKDREVARAKTMMMVALSKQIKSHNTSLLTKVASVKDRADLAVHESESTGSSNDWLGMIKSVISEIIPLHEKPVEASSAIITGGEIKTPAASSSAMVPAKGFAQLILEETNTIIDKTTRKIVDRIVELKEKNTKLEDALVENIIKEELVSANKTGNDVIAKNISSTLIINTIPPPPYTPVIKTISVSYVAGIQLQKQKYELSKDDNLFFHLLPFGLVEMEPPWKKDAISSVHEKTKYLFPFTMGFYDQEAYLGIHYQPYKLTNEQKKELNLKISDGVIVTDVDENSPGNIYGIKKGDVIIQVNAVKVTSGSEMTEQLLRYKAGNKISLTYVRKGRENTSENILLKSRDKEKISKSALYIGVRDVTPNQNLCMLFEMADGTRTSDKDPGVLEWWYLTGNKWEKLLKKNHVSDSTYNLQKSGIIELSVPKKINTDNSLFQPQGLFWLACTNDTDDAFVFPNLLNVSCNACSTTFKFCYNALSHYDAALPAGKIKNFVERLPAIKKVQQPLPSSNGERPELYQPEAYYTRVSERLRHKNRAINNWDYERLVLEHFKFVYKVKCINNYYNGKFVQGHVTVVPICDMRNKGMSAFKMLSPKSSYVDLREIEKMISAKVPPFVKVHAINPELIYLMIDCKVKFINGVDNGFYLQQLNEDLKVFLSPWMTDTKQTISFSSKIYLSSVVSFMDKLSYVQYVRDVKMKQSGLKAFFKPLVETQFENAHSILVSVPQHNIELDEEQ